MKILLYGVNYAPELTGIGKYSGEMAASLAKAGHDVRVVTAPPYYPAWEVAKGYSAWRYDREQRDGVDVWRAPLWVPALPGGLTRVLHLLSFALTSMPVMLRQAAWQPDVVMTVAPAFVCAPVGWLTAKLSGAKSWLHIQDYEVDVAVNIGFIRGRVMTAVARALERSVLRRFDRISSISGNMVRRAGQKGVDAARLRLLPNWVDVENVGASTAVGNYRTELKIADDAVVALYSGSLAGKHGLTIITDSARRLAATRPDVVFVICGEGVMKAELEAACEGLSNVRFLPLQPANRLGELLCTADVHLLPQSEQVEDLVMPSKLCGMLASGRPVVATCRPDTEIARAVSQCGVIVAPGDEAAFSDAIVRLAAEPEQRVELGYHARLYAETHLASSVILRRLADDLASLAAKPLLVDRIEAPGKPSVRFAGIAGTAEQIIVPNADSVSPPSIGEVAVIGVSHAALETSAP